MILMLSKECYSQAHIYYKRFYRVSRDFVHCRIRIHVLMVHEDYYSWIQIYYKRFSIPGYKFIIKDCVHYQEILYTRALKDNDR